MAALADANVVSDARKLRTQLLDQRVVLLLEDHDPRRRILELIREFRGSQAEIQRRRDVAGPFRRAEELAVLDAVHPQERDAVLTSQPEPIEARGQAPRPLGELSSTSRGAGPAHTRS